MRIEQELQKMGFVLPTPKPLAAHIPAVKVGNLVFTAGQGPNVDGKALVTGKLGREVTEELIIISFIIYALFLSDWIRTTIGFSLTAKIIFHLYGLHRLHFLWECLSRLD